MVSASDAYYAALLNDIKTNDQRRARSLEAFAKGSRKYWYYIYEDYCPVCGKSDVARERMYYPRPNAWEDRHQMAERYDWCEG